MTTGMTQITFPKVDQLSFRLTLVSLFPEILYRCVDKTGPDRLKQILQHLSSSQSVWLLTTVGSKIQTSAAKIHSKPFNRNPCVFVRACAYVCVCLRKSE